MGGWQDGPLVLNTIQTVPLVLVPCNPNFGRSTSYKEGNLVRPKYLQQLHRLEYVCHGLKESRYSLYQSQEGLLTSYATPIAPLVEPPLKGLD